MMEMSASRQHTHIDKSAAEKPRSSLQRRTAAFLKLTADFNNCRPP